MSGFAGQRAALYARVSTARQAGEDRWSLPTQKAKFEEWCARQGAEAAGEFVDVLTGRRDDRREYQRLLSAVRAKEIDVVVVQWLDRFGRNHREVLPRMWEIESIGGHVVATDEDVSHELIRMVRAWQGGEESKRTSERVRAVMEHVAREGRWMGAAPYGYRVITDRADKARGRLVIEDAEAAVVRRLFARYVAGNVGWA